MKVLCTVKRRCRRGLTMKEPALGLLFPLLFVYCFMLFVLLFVYVLCVILLGGSRPWGSCTRRRACRRGRSSPRGPRGCRPGGAKDCTPEIDTSEIIADCQWLSPMDVQWHVPTEFHFSVAFSKGLSLFLWIFTRVVQWTFSGIFQWSFTFVISGV